MPQKAKKSTPPTEIASAITEHFTNLNDAQKRIVARTAGPLLVIAGPDQRANRVAAGESVQLNIGGTKIPARCLEIKEQSVVLAIEGLRGNRELHLK